VASRGRLAHIAAMRGAQPRGPYRLGGFCNGGLLAYEMARQLERDGEQIDFLGLLSPSEPIQHSALQQVCGRAHRLTRPGSSRQADLYLRVRHAQRHLYRLLRPRGSRVQDFAKLLAIEPRLKAMFPPREALYRDYVDVFNWAAAAAKTGISGGKTTYYWTREEPAIAQAWQPVISCTGPGRSEEHEVAGALMSGVTDHIQEIAEILSECLTRAEHEARRREQYERPDAPVNTAAMSWPDPYPAGIAVRRMQTKLHLWAAQYAGRRFDDLFNSSAIRRAWWSRGNACPPTRAASTPGIDKAHCGRCRVPGWGDEAAGPYPGGIEVWFF
jgi:hypothetical protein